MSNLQDEILRYVYKRRENHSIFAVTLDDICYNFKERGPVTTLRYSLSRTENC